LAVGGGGDEPEGGKPSLVPVIGNDGGKAGFVGEDGGRCGVKVICCPSLDSVLEAVHASKRGGVRGREMCPVSEYGVEEAVGDAMAEAGSNTCSWGG